MRRFFFFRSSSLKGEKDNENSGVANDDKENFLGSSVAEEKKSVSHTLEVSASARLRRSLSLSTLEPHNMERCLASSADLSGSLSDCSNIPDQPFEIPFSHERRAERLHSPGFSRRKPESQVYSAHSSPIRSGRRSSRVFEMMNEKAVQDNFYTERDIEHKEIILKSRDSSFASYSGQSSERITRVHPCSRKPPRGDIIGHEFDCARNSNERDSRSFLEKFEGNFKSQTSIMVKDIYDNNSNSLMENRSHDLLCLHSTVDGYLSEARDASFTGKHGDRLDKELHAKLNEVEDQAKIIPEIQVDIENVSVSDERIMNLLIKVSEEKRKLASELSFHLRSRISERSNAREALKQAKRDLDTRTRRLERERDEVKSCLEKELERRSNDWSATLERFQAEEKRLNARIRELAEQNGCVRKEAASLSTKQLEVQHHVKDLESKLNVTKVTLENMSSENSLLRKALSDLKEKFNAVEADCKSVKRSLKLAEEEAKETKRVISKLHIIRADQEKTIAGLRKVRTGQPQDDDDALLSELRAENTRLAGVELGLRNESESLRNQVESLKREIDFLLVSNRSNKSLFGLDQELHSQMDSLKNEAFTLLDESDSLCYELINRCDFENGAVRRYDGPSLLELDMKFQGLRREVKIFKRRVESLSLAFDQRSKLDDFDVKEQARNMEGDQPREEELELKLMAEALLTSVLKEKLLQKELDLGRLQVELGSSVKESEVLQAKFNSMQDDASSLTDQVKDMKHQILKKDESISRLQQDFQGCSEELRTNEEMLLKISNERDHLWKELNRSREKCMLLDHEVKLLRKKIEDLEEDVLIKEGQITILRDNFEKRSAFF
ncbi:uncharacterized protein LOC144702042 [Wolffia australiana]